MRLSVHSSTNANEWEGCSTSIASPIAEWLSPNEDDAWDAFVGEHPLGLVYHLSAWKKMLERAFPHIRGRFLVLRDLPGGKIIAGVPLYTVRSWLLGNRMVSVPFASFCDPLVSSIGEFEHFLPSIQKACTYDKCRQVGIRTGNVERTFLSRLAGARPEFIYKHHILKLDKAPDALFSSFAKSSICQKINKARKAGVTVVEAHGPESMKVCHAILAQTRRKVSLPPFPLAFFLAMQSQLAPDYLKVFLAMHQGKPVGCHLILAFKDLWISEYSGNTEGAIHGVNQLLYWETIQRALSGGASTFSFGRTSPTNEGLLAYKRRWATIEEDLADFAIPMHSEESDSASKQLIATREDGLPFRAVRFVVARAPASVCDIIGWFCYRHLG